eukprot:8093948-Heterocapsa_arctica.AAC.1
MPGAGCNIPWRVVTYNSQGRGANARTQDIMTALPCTVMGIQRTGVTAWRFPEPLPVMYSNLDKHEMIQWPWFPGDSGSNRTCGVSLVSNTKRMNKYDIFHIWPAPAAFR